MPCINNKVRLYKVVCLIETITITFVMLLINMLHSHHETAKGHISSLIRIANAICKEISYYFNGIFVFINNAYLELNKIFNNREIAIGFWLLVFMIYFLSLKNIRSQLPGMIKILLSKKLVIWYFCMMAYFGVMILILIRMEFWNRTLLKDTIIWFITVGIVTCGKSVGKANDLKYFIDIIKGNIKILVIIQFISKLYSFSFIIESALVIIIVFISMILAKIDVSPQYKDKDLPNLKIFLNAVLGIIGFCMLYHSIRLLIINIHVVNIQKLEKDMLLPIILSIMFIFFIYFFVIYSEYEQLFIRLSFKKTIDDKVRKYLIIRILLFCNLNIIRINNFILRSRVMNSYVTSKKDANKLIKNYKDYKKDSTQFIT